MKMFLFTFSFMVVLFFSFSGTIAVVNACPTITVTNPTQTVYVANINSNYDAMFTQTGGAEPVTFSIHSGILPPTFTLFANGRLFSQGYTIGGSITFTVQVTDANGCIGIGPQITLTNSSLDDPDLSAMISLRDNCGWGAAFAWPTNSNPCPNSIIDVNWNGVTCLTIDGQYRTAIIIAACGGIKLNGTLNAAPYLSTLTALKSLDIRSCYTTQPRAATEFGFLNTFSQLERLRLDGNTGLTGTMADIFPDGFNNSRFPNMIAANGVFYIGNTQISGSLPAGLFTFSAGDFRFQQAQFSGMLPATGSSLPTQLWLNGNKLEGTLPDVIRNAPLSKTIYLRYNMLDVENTPSGNIDQIDPLWRTTQTVPPTNVQVVSNSPNSATLNWTPIAYQDHGGYYEVLSATTPGGPYTSRGMTAGKTATGLTVTGLPVGTNYFVVRTFTPAHVSAPINQLTDNPNNLTSPNSAEVSAIVCSATTLYVDQSITASGNGATWATAFKTLDEALLAAHNCPDVTTINVAAGTYKPTKKPYENGTEITTADARDITFHIPTNVAIYGGYPTGGGIRDISANPTILSGDLAGNDDFDPANGGYQNNTGNDNCYHVALMITSLGHTSVFDGFTVTGGKTDINQVSYIIVNGVNYSRRTGGGIITRNEGTQTLTNNTICNNAASTSGGGLFTRNMGGVQNITHNTVYNNIAGGGGGLILLNSSGGTQTLANNTIHNNTATNSGGGGVVAQNDAGTALITNNTLYGNTADGNNSSGVGGGIYSININGTISGAIGIVNNTIYNNAAKWLGGGLYVDGIPLSAAFANNIFWENKRGGSSNVQFADLCLSPTGTGLSHNITQYNFIGYPQIINQDPLFVDAGNPAGPDGIHRTADDGLRLQAGSPAINAGNNAVIPAGITTDIIGADRIQGGTVDMGAYEGGVAPSCPVITTTTVTACGSYTWTVNGQTYTQPGIYTVQVTDCHTEILDLTIPPGQVVSLNGNTTVCAGSIIGLTATGGNQYQWSGPNGYSATGGSISRTNATVAMSGAYTVTITNNECITILSTTVTVYPIPAAIITGATSVCSGGAITLSAPAGAASYQWSGPGGFTQNTGTDNTLTRPNATTLMGGLYRVTVTNAGGCTATASRSVSVSAPTTATVTGATSVCSNGTVNLTATTAGVGYQWSGPGGFSFSGAAMTRTPAVAGAYTVTVTNASGCISTASRTVTVNASPNLTVTNNSNCTRVWLVASGGNGYVWSGPNGYTVTGATVLRNPASATMFGTYTVTVTGTGGCTASASVTVNPCSGKTQSLPPDLSLSAYPNPTPGIVQISFTNVESEEVLLAIYTAEGKEVNTLFTGIAEAYTNYTLRFDGSYLPNGVYYAVLRRAGGATEQLPIMVVK